MHKAEQDRCLIQFLMGLNEVCTVVRGIILMMNPLPTMAQTFSILIQEENQREVRPSNRLHLESTSLLVKGHNGYKNSGAGSGNNFRTNYTSNPNAYRNESKTVYINTNSSPICFPNSSNYKNTYNSKSHLFCNYCKRTDHTEDKCYKLHGFPLDFKFTRRRNSALASNVYGSTDGDGARVAANNNS